MENRETRDVEKEARKAARQKLRRIIDRYGDADGERRKPCYLEQLTQEAAAAIHFQMFSEALISLEKANCPGPPTKATEAEAAV